MGLDFTSIPDKEGAAAYILHTGNTLEVERLSRLRDDIIRSNSHQVILVDINSADGEKICEFYELDREALPTVIIVQDDDSIAYQWDGDAIPTSGSDIAYQLDQISQ